jgi:hypothetical protein
MYAIMWSTSDYPAPAFLVTTVDPILNVRYPRNQFHSCDDQLPYDICEYQLNTALTL